MKHVVLLFVAALAVWAPAPAAAVEGPLFSCAQRAPNVCRFRIFFPGGDRIVVLAAGMKQKVPGITVGQDYYCVGVNQNPSWTCARKLVAATTNS